MVRVSFVICAWTILPILRVGCADCLEATRHLSAQRDRHPRRLSRRQESEATTAGSSTASFVAQLKMEVRTVNASHVERQNRGKKRSFSLGGSSSTASLDNETSVVGQLNSTRVAKHFTLIKGTFTSPLIVTSSPESPASENVTEFTESLRRGNSLSHDNSTSSWQNATLAQGKGSTSSSTSTSFGISIYGEEPNRLFGIVRSGQGDSRLLVGSLTERSISQDHPVLGNGGNVSSEERTLLNFIGPDILRDADSIAEQNSPEFIHLRVKRDKVLSKVTYPLREDLNLNSSHPHDLPHSFPTRSESPYNDFADEGQKLIGNFVHSTARNSIDSSTQPNRSLSAPESRLSVPSTNEVVRSERGNSNTKNSQDAPNGANADVANDSKSAMRMVENIRKRRQTLASKHSLGNRSSYRAVLEDSYPEDDEVIESMLSKVDYNALGRNSLARASPLQLQENWAIGKSGKKRRTPTVDLVSRYEKKAARNRHKDRSRAKRKEKRFLQGVPSRLMQDKSILPNSLLGVINDYLQVESKIEKRKHRRRADNVDDKRATVPEEDQSVVSPHDGRRQIESFEEKGYGGGTRHLQNQSSQWNRDQSEDELRRVKRHEDDAGDAPKRRVDDVQELLYYEDIHEPDAAPRHHEASFAKRRRRSRSGKAAKSVEQIKELVEKLVAKVAELRNYVSNDGESTRQRKKVEPEKTNGSSLKEEPRPLEHSTSILDASNSSETRTNGKVEIQETRQHEERPNSVGRINEDRTSLKGSSKVMAMATAGRRGSRRARRKRKSHRKWDRWTDWSSCSVTCGKGRQIRWRHCIHDCTTAETEMEEKACQLPACAPGKFFGIF